MWIQLWPRSLYFYHTSTDITHYYTRLWLCPIWLAPHPSGAPLCSVSVCHGQQNENPISFYWYKVHILILISVVGVSFWLAFPNVQNIYRLSLIESGSVGVSMGLFPFQLWVYKRERDEGRELIRIPKGKFDIWNVITSVRMYVRSIYVRYYVLSSVISSFQQSRLAL